MGSASQPDTSAVLNPYTRLVTAPVAKAAPRRSSPPGGASCFWEGIAARAASARHCRTVCLGGGCFFNRILRERVLMRLQAAGLAVLLPAETGCGDAGLAADFLRKRYQRVTGLGRG